MLRQRSSERTCSETWAAHAGVASYETHVAPSERRVEPTVPANHACSAVQKTSILAPFFGRTTLDGAGAAPRLRGLGSGLARGADAAGGVAGATAADEEGSLDDEASDLAASAAFAPRRSRSNWSTASCKSAACPDGSKSGRSRSRCG